MSNQTYIVEITVTRITDINKNTGQILLSPSVVKHSCYKIFDNAQDLKEFVKFNPVEEIVVQ